MQPLQLFVGAARPPATLLVQAQDDTHGSGDGVWLVGMRPRGDGMPARVARLARVRARVLRRACLSCLANETKGTETPPCALHALSRARAGARGTLTHGLAGYLRWRWSAPQRRLRRPQRSRASAHGVPSTLRRHKRGNSHARGECKKTRGTQRPPVKRARRGTRFPALLHFWAPTPFALVPAVATGTCNWASGHPPVRARQARLAARWASLG